MHTSEGGLISALVNMDQNERLLEIEFIYWDDGKGVTPDWSTLSIGSEPANYGPGAI